MANSDAAPERAQIVVSIINYRTADMTLRCVESVLADIGEMRVHIVVVDNRSDDGSADEIAAGLAARPTPAPVTLVRSPTNSGYSGGHNQGMAAMPADAYLILNSDALLRPGALATLWRGLRDRPEVGLLAPRLEDEDGTPQISCFRLHSPASEIIRAAETGLVTRLLRRWDVPLRNPPDPAAIEWVSFACVLVRGAMRDAIGPMDEGYFLYFEDSDYCLRARRGGWRTAYLPEARVVHLRGGSAPVKKLAAARRRLPPYYYASRTRFMRVAFGRAGPLLANLGWHLGRAVAHLRLLAGRAVPTRVAAEPLDIWINALDPLGDRRAPRS